MPLPKPLLAIFAILLTAIPTFAAPTHPCTVLTKLPHSTESYTEGFFYLDGRFYEGTGREGHSAILVTDPATGKVLQRHEIPPQYFGEGIIDFGPNLIEWTWQTHIGFVFDRATFRTLATFHYDGEGWGITRTATELITSDGTSTLRFRNPANFAETRHIVVHDGPTPSINSTSSNTSTGEHLRQHLALRPHRPHLAPRRPRHRLDRPAPASCPPNRRSTLSPSSTASPTTPSATVSSSPANNGPPSSRSRSRHYRNSRLSPNLREVNSTKVAQQLSCWLLQFKRPTQISSEIE